MFRNALLACLPILCANAAFGASTTTTGSVTVIPPDTDAAFVDAFDPALGVLDRVTIEAEVSAFMRAEVVGRFGDVVVETFSSEALFSNRFEFFEPDFMFGGPFANEVTFVLDDSLAGFPFDGDVMLFPFEFEIFDQFEFTTTDPEVLDYFTDPSPADFPFAGGTNVFLSSGGPGFSVDASLTITYDFTPTEVPAPPSLALLAGALLIGAGWSRRAAGRAGAAG